MSEVASDVRLAPGWVRRGCRVLTAQPNEPRTDVPLGGGAGHAHAQTDALTHLVRDGPMFATLSKEML